jgi:hypothetical protein
VGRLTGLLPEARIVHVIRDGRDVACSLRHLWFSPGTTMEDQAAFWRDCVSAARQAGAASGRYLEVRYEDLVRDAADVLGAICRFIELPLSERMLDYHHGARERLAEHGDRVRTDGTLLVSHTDRVGQQALTALPPQASRVGAWEQAMSAEEQARFVAVAGGLLAELGYR